MVPSTKEKGTNNYFSSLRIKEMKHKCPDGKLNPVHFFSNAIAKGSLLDISSKVLTIINKMIIQIFFSPILLFLSVFITLSKQVICITFKKKS